MSHTHVAQSSGKSIGAQAAAGAFWTAIGFASFSLCGYFNAVLLARGFGPVAYGVYGVVYSVLMASELILRFGVPQALSKLIGGSAQSDQSALESSGVWLTLGVSLAGFAALWIAAPWLAIWLNVADGVVLFRIAILDLPFFGLFGVLVNILSGRRDFRFAGIVRSTYAIARTAGIAVLFFAGELTIEGALIVNIAASVIGVLLLIPRNGARAFRPTISEHAGIFAIALPITIADIGMQCLLGLDLWLLSFLGTSLPPEIRGSYVAALSLARGPNIIAQVMVSVLVPLIARAQSTGQHAAAGNLIQGTMRFLLVLLLPACALIAADSADLMVLFFGDSYRSGAAFLAMLVFAQGLGFTVLATFQSILIGTGHAPVAWHRVYVGLVSALVLNLILIPPFGAFGAAASALLAFAVANVLLGRFVRRQVGKLAEPSQAVLAIAISVGVAILAWFIPASGPWVMLELGVLGLAALGLMWGVGLISSSDLALLLGRRDSDSAAMVGAADP